MTVGSRSADGGQAAFIQRIRSALGVAGSDRPAASEVLTSRATAASRSALDRVRNRTWEQALVLLKQLQAAAWPINLQVEPVPEPEAAACAIRKIVLESEPEWGGAKEVAIWDHPLLDSLKLEPLLAADDIPVHTIATPDPSHDPDEALRAEAAAKVRASFVGVTGADYCVAESATMVMKTRPGRARSVSLVPSIHIAVIRLEQVVESFTELYSLLCFDPGWRQEGTGGSMTFISGPSKTADIEACMVHGAHGPREVRLVVIGKKSEYPISNNEPQKG